jgi:hypothetical protein
MPADRSAAQELDERLKLLAREDIDQDAAGPRDDEGFRAAA